MQRVITMIGISLSMSRAGPLATTELFTTASLDTCHAAARIVHGWMMHNLVDPFNSPDIHKDFPKSTPEYLARFIDKYVATS